MKLLNSHFWKFFAGLICLVLLGFAVLFTADYYKRSKIANERAKQEKAYQDLKKLYASDTYGGKTPEETLALFIDALKKGDVDLAAKYFLPNEQDKWRQELNKDKIKDNFVGMINDAKKLKPSKNDGEKAFFTIANEKNIVEVQVILGKNQNSIWKILEL